jgi:hypothetical protein
MPHDPAMEEVRRVRHEISREAGHDLRRLKATFALLESQFQRPPVDHGAQRAKGINSAMDKSKLRVT